MSSYIFYGRFLILYIYISFVNDPSCFPTQLEKFKNMIPFDQMTIDDLNHTFPETKLDKEKYPYWPHKPIADL